jgi:CheY-like chemotaxis protein
MCEGMIMKRKTVLVIEDNGMNMKLVRALLQIGQHDLLEAVDAESVIPLARAHKPDLILMDVHVPGMDGL